MSLGDEAGSVTVLTIGLLAVLLAALVTVVSTTHVQLQRSRLAHVADETALAAADTVDLDAYYRSGVVTLEVAAVSEAAAAQLAYSSRRQGVADAVLVDASSADGSTVEIELALRTPMLLGAPWLPGRVDLTATASARAVP
ncbi:pilus assembly protein TadG-related protein [Demequina mangrovi]|uniref:Putative Flp pilus-assembly TadE/G-like n=1 Tax=Demequina mangrovi TaxID=1043493 RepID=A0A1H6XUC2_9MICO|nr:pilus assembly protein TadG-related protein [Demequina mangrovi]SEJ32668.1 Putative Flp pilus-assembly TadE/G-like [Demequina mangrovi]